MFQHRNNMHGVSLIEALIAAVVLSVGLIAVAKLQSDLVSNAGTTKARSEAITLMEAEMETFRNFVLQNQYDVNVGGWWDSGGSTPCTVRPPEDGTNATFTRTWCMDRLTSPERRRLTLTYGWNDPRGQPQEIALRSIIAWDDPMLSASLAQDPSLGGGSNGPPPRSPGGAGFELVNPPTNDDGQPTIPGIPPNPGMYDPSGNLVSNPSEARYVVDDAGNVWEARGGASISTISGWIFAEKGVNPAISLSEIQLLSSGGDQLPCVRGTWDSTLASHHRMTFTCFKTEGWYGNVAVVYTGNQPPRVCVGDASIVNHSSNSISRHPWPSAGRSYRGFKIEDDTPDLLVTGLPNSSLQYTEQNFLLTRFNLGGSATDQDQVTGCRNRMTALTGTPMNRPSPPNDVAWTHAGTFVCTSDGSSEPAQTNSTCPATLPTGDPPVTTISGTITRRNVNNQNQAVLNSLTIENGACAITNTTNTSYTYQCSINWRGVAISPDAGQPAKIELDLATSHVLCATGTTYDGLPSLTITPSSEPPTITIPAVGPAVPTIDLGFAIRHPNATCP